MKTSMLVVRVLGLALLCACASSNASGGRDLSGGAAGTLGVAVGGGAGMAVGAGGTAPVVDGTPWIQGGTAGTGLVSPVFGDPMDYGSGGGAPDVDCTHPSPGTCDWSRLDGCCREFGCANASESLWDDTAFNYCSELVSCLQANPSCITDEDPLCSARDGAVTSPCTVEVETAGLEPGRPGALVRDAVTCVCGI